VQSGVFPERPSEGAERIVGGIGKQACVDRIEVIDRALQLFVRIRRLGAIDDFFPHAAGQLVSLVRAAFAYHFGLSLHFVVL